MNIRLACAADNDALIAFFLRTPIVAGTVFVLDRGPVFSALLDLRGESRTFVAESAGRLVGTASAVWRDVRRSDVAARVGEVVDVRVDPAVRHGPVAFRLLEAVRDTLDAVGVNWITCLIGNTNQAARQLVRGCGGIPSLYPVRQYASRHFMARRYLSLRTDRYVVRRSPSEDKSQRRWAAIDASGRCVGALEVRDTSSARRMRVIQYAPVDRAIRGASLVAGAFRLAVPLPSPGDPLKVWASEAFSVSPMCDAVARTLVHAALDDATRAGVHIVQINLPADDALNRALPRSPSSLFRSTLYACRRRPSSSGPEILHADLALV